MRDQLTEELISAYLDGELSADETARVEQALDQSAECRELYEDLKGLRSSIQSLPRFSLPDDFPSRVLRRAERELLTPTPPPPTVLPAAERDPQHLRAWQLAAVTAATIAAALLFALVVVSRQQDFRPAGQPIRPGDQIVGNPDAPVVPPSVPDSGEPSLDSDQIAVAMPREETTYVFVIDLAITPEGQRRTVFENAMKRAGIPFDPSIRVNQQLEKLLLDNRFLGKVQRVPLDAQEGPEQGDEIEMVYVTGSGSQIESAIGDLQTRPAEHIARVQFDMAIEPDERALFRQLNDAMRFAKRQPGNSSRARRLVFRFSLRSSPSFLGAIATPSFQTELVPEADAPPKAGIPMSLFLETPAQEVEAEPEKEEPQHSEEPRADRLEQPQIQFEVLFILRNLNEPAAVEAPATDDAPQP